MLTVCADGTLSADKHGEACQAARPVFETATTIPRLRGPAARAGVYQKLPLDGGAEPPHGCSYRSMFDGWPISGTGDGWRSRKMGQDDGSSSAKALIVCEACKDDVHPGEGLERAEVVAELEGFADTFVFLYQQIHDRLRDEVSGLSEPALSWAPGPNTSSISTLVVHLLGSETEVLQIVRGLPSDRDRASEFSAYVGDPEELLSRIHATDRLLVELGPQITNEDLATLWERPSAVRNRAPRTGLFWLLNSYGHAREHLAQLQLTKQLFHEIHQSDLPDG
jgi:hypothetical protein